MVYNTPDLLKKMGILESLFILIPENSRACKEGKGYQIVLINI